ncbi:hypothetical protein IWZ00DRAFT_187248 [Phyllosticta capitalensis]
MMAFSWNRKYSYSPLIPIDEPKPRHPFEKFRGRPLARLLRIPVAFMLVLLIFLLFYFPREVHPWLDTWGQWRSPIHGVHPIPCHSHNDYLKSPPLYAALATGCTSIEADIWLDDGELYVGHRKCEITSNDTLSSMYIEPLKQILEAANFNGDTEGPHSGVFAAAPWQSLVLVIDFKTGGKKTLPHLEKALEPLRQRGWLAHWNGIHRVPGPVTVVGSGSLPYYVVTANTTYRDVFLDAPLHALEHKSDVAKTSTFKYNPSNSHYASTKLSKGTGIKSLKNLKSDGLERMRSQIHEAKIRGLVPRYWGTPSSPRNLLQKFWSVLLQEGVGVVNVDDLLLIRRLRWKLQWKQPAVNVQNRQ